jgi:hypothetical protein
VRLKRDLFTAAQQGQKKAESLQAENVEEALA